jgi:hypothetical protein
MACRAVLALTLFVGLVACQPPPPPDPVVVALGEHRISFEVPEGWLHADHGREQLFENGMAHLTLSDLGAATPEGFAEIIREARSLFDSNQWEDARTLLVASHPRRFFAREARWKAVKDDWAKVTRIRRGASSGSKGGVSADVDWEVSAAFHDLLAQVAVLRPLDLDTLARAALVEMGHDELRAVASEFATSISGRPALRIETWDRLSHSGRQSHLFVLSEGRLLCIKTGLGAFDLLEPAFESLVASLSIVSVQGDGGA